MIYHILNEKLSYTNTEYDMMYCGVTCKKVPAELPPGMAFVNDNWDGYLISTCDKCKNDFSKQRLAK